MEKITEITNENPVYFKTLQFRNDRCIKMPVKLIGGSPYYGYIWIDGDVYRITLKQRGKGCIIKQMTK